MNAKDLYYLAIPLMMVICVVMWLWARGSLPRNARLDAERKLAQMGIALNRLGHLIEQRKTDARRLFLQTQHRYDDLQARQPDHKRLTALAVMLGELSELETTLAGHAKSFQDERAELLAQIRSTNWDPLCVAKSRRMLTHWSELLEPAEETGGESILVTRQRITNQMHIFGTWIHRGIERLMRQRSSVFELERVNAQHSALPGMKERLEECESELEALRAGVADIAEKREMLDLRLSTNWNLYACRPRFAEILADCQKLNQRFEEHFSLN